MVQEKQNQNQKKVDYKLLSKTTCKECNRPLKLNSEYKGHTLCFVCFKIANGKGTKELLCKQKQNKAEYLPNKSNHD